MSLTNKQELALKETVERFRNGERYVVISGYAGVGKSYLIKYIIAALESFGIDSEEDVCYTAFTGKACQVLSDNGNPNVSTLHKLLYESRLQPNGKFLRMKRRSLDYKVVVVDECSMVPKSMVDQLMAFPNVFLIFSGDPGQLPPIRKDEDNHLLDHPHVFLDEIMRQALDSDIIRLSMKIREGSPLEYGKGKDVIVLPKSELRTGMLTWADQILVATNNTRATINAQMRKLMEHEGGPQAGDKIVCVRNYWDEISVQGNALINGTVGYLKNSYENFIQYPKYLCAKQKIWTIDGTFVSDSGNEYENIRIDRDMIINEKCSITPEESYKLYKNKKYRGSQPYEFLYGYAITVHKAQGSQWDKVLMIEEGFPYDREEHKKHLYTAVTRASEHLVLALAE